MPSSNLWNKLYLRRGKAGLILLILLLGGGYVHAQTPMYSEGMINPNYDSRKKITYGFTIGIHTSSLKIKYNDLFNTSKFDTLHSIMPRSSPGFSLGFIVNLAAADLLDLRIMPKVSFYEYAVDYNFTNGDKDVGLAESTSVEFPLIAKFKSMRRGNSRMYVVGGIMPGFDASGKGDIQDREDRLKVRKFNTSLELGIGMDMYFPLFKFSPEIRYSYGLLNVLDPNLTKYTEPLSAASTHVFTFYFLFQ